MHGSEADDKPFTDTTSGTYDDEYDAAYDETPLNLANDTFFLTGLHIAHVFYYELNAYQSSLLQY